MSTLNKLTLRGTIIQVPDSNNPGLLVVDGAQRTFTLEGVWRSAVAPALNQIVDVETASSGTIASLTAVDSRQIAKERMNQLGGAAEEHGKQVAALARQGLGALATRMGKVTLGASAVLWVAWFFLPALKFSMFMASRSFTFWEILGADVARPGFGGESHGLFALVGLGAIACPFVVPFLRRRWARWLNAAPLAFLVLTFLKIRWDISSAVRQMGKAGGGMASGMGMFGAQMAETAMKSAMKSMTDAMSIGYGTYVLVAVAIFLAVRSFRGTAGVSGQRERGRWRESTSAAVLRRESDTPAPCWPPGRLEYHLAAPTLDGAVCQQRARLRVSRGDCSHSTESATRHRHGNQGVHSATVAELPAKVVSPTLDDAPRHHRTGVVVPRIDSRDATQPHNRHGG